MNVVGLSALNTGRFYPKKYSFYLFQLEAELTPESIVWQEGLCQWKIPVTPSEMEPTIFRLVAVPHQTVPSRASIRSQGPSKVVRHSMVRCSHAFISSGGGDFEDFFVNCDLINNKKPTPTMLGISTFYVILKLWIKYYIAKIFIVKW
jgi:hypothetical protein